jgi:urease accessory protein
MGDRDALHWLSPLLQVSDPLFPTGGYAHSMGLEGWIACMEAEGSRAELGGFLMDHALPVLRCLELPHLRFALESLQSEGLEPLFELELQWDALKWSEELRKASTGQGSGRLRILRRLLDDPRLEQYAKALQDSRVMGHHLMICALQFSHHQLPLAAALQAYAYQALSGYAAAAVKLMRIGQEKVQLALHRAVGELPCCVAQSLSLEAGEAGWFAPFFDISSARHASAFSRLFLS